MQQPQIKQKTRSLKANTKPKTILRIMVKFLVWFKFKIAIFELSLETPKYSPDPPAQKLKQENLLGLYLDGIVIMLAQQL